MLDVLKPAGLYNNSINSDIHIYIYIYIYILPRILVMSFHVRSMLSAMSVLLLSMHLSSVFQNFHFRSR